MRLVIIVGLAGICGLTLSLPLLAQGGSGVPGSYFIHNGSLLGGTLAVDYGYPGLSGAIAVLSLSDGYGPTVHPPVGSMAEARAMHTATSLSRGPWDDETRVLIAGGGTGTIINPVPSATTELYNPMKRAFDPGPKMAVARLRHQAVQLLDGRVLLCGGLTASGVATAA
jgi:hypothetical protein